MLWPPALSRFGPRIEDSYFLAALHRVTCGQAPYRDFEFLYGPLMIALPKAWMGVAGYSMTSYYTVYAGLQVALYVLLWSLLQAFLTRFRDRLVAFVLIVPFVLDILFGLNWIAWRYAAVVPVLLLLAPSREEAGISAARALAAGAVTGLAVGYSYEYGLATLLAGLAVLGFRLAGPGAPVVRLLGAAALVVVAALATAYALVRLAIGDSFGDYLTSLAHVAGGATDLGLGQFAFHWTVLFVAEFAVLAIVVVAGALGLRRLRKTPMTQGDALVIGAGAFALVALKIALQRADYLHLAVPFAPLILVLLLSPPTRLVALARPLRRVAFGLIAVAAAAQAVGHAPLGRWMAEGIARGFLHEAQGRPRVGAVEARGPSLLSERSEAVPAAEALAARLAAADLRARPVLFYAGLWDMAAATGVCPAGYSFYDVLYSDDLRPLGDTAGTPGLIVVIARRDLEALLSDEPVPASARNAPLDRLQAIVASRHAYQSALENEVEEQMWREAIGNRLLTEFRERERVGDFVLMERAP